MPLRAGSPCRERRSGSISTATATRRRLRSQSPCLKPRRPGSWKRETTWSSSPSAAGWLGRPAWCAGERPASAAIRSAARPPRLSLNPSALPWHQRPIPSPGRPRRSPVANPDQEKIAWVFPGQGSQRVGMGRELAQLDPEMATLYAAADDMLGFSLSKIIFDGPEAALQETPVQQPAILLTSIAYLRLLRNQGLLPDADYVAGHSLGEYAAMVAAGSLSFEDALRLVRRRGELMQEHGAGAMAAILGLAAEDVAAIAGDAGAEVANFNTPVQTRWSRQSHWPGSAARNEPGCFRSAAPSTRR